MSKSCRYGYKCYITNPNHFIKYTHKKESEFYKNINENYTLDKLMEHYKQTLSRCQEGKKCQHFLKREDEKEKNNKKYTKNNHFNNFHHEEHDGLIFKYNGFVFEKICELCIAFKVSCFKDAELYFGNGEFKTPLKNKNIKKWLLNEKFQSGSDGGQADIKFKIKDKFFGFSAKYFRNQKGEDNEKDLKKYDIDSIFTELIKNYPNLQIGLFVRNKKELIKKINRSKNAKFRSELKKLTKDFIFGEDTIDIWYRRLRTKLQKYNTVESRIEYLSRDKPELKLRPHQFIIVELFYKKIEKFNEILLNAVPRCGKSYIAGGIMKKGLSMLDITKKFKKILWITPNPTSCTEGYKEMINKFQCFKHLDFKISYQDGKNNLTYIDDNILHLVSKQISIDKQDKENNRGIVLDYKKYDLIIIDEAHGCMSIDNLKNIDKMLKCNIKLLYLTGTSELVEEKRDLNKDQIIRYTYTDVQMLKEEISDLPNYLNKYYPEEMEKYLKINNINDKNLNIINREIRSNYIKFPNLQTINCEIKNMESYDEEIGFNLSKLFSMNETNFIHTLNIKKIFSTIFGSSNSNSGESLVEKCNIEKKNIHLVFLPCGGPDSNISFLQKMLKKLLNEDEFIKENYKIIHLNSNDKEKNQVKFVKDHFKNTEKSVIVLLGNMLNVGCSIPNAVSCTMLNDDNTKYKSNTIQKMFRCLTENDGKKTGFIFNFCPKEDAFSYVWKLLKTNNMTSDEKIKFILKHKMFRFLKSNFEFKEYNFTDINGLFTDMSKNLNIEKDMKLDINKMSKDDINKFKKNISCQLIKNYSDDRKSTNYKNVKKYEKKITTTKIKEINKKIIEAINIIKDKNGNIHSTFTKLFNILIATCNPFCNYNNFRNEVIKDIISNYNFYKSVLDSYNSNLNITLKDKFDLIIAIDFIINLIDKVINTDLQLRFDFVQNKKLKNSYKYSNMLDLLKKLLKPTIKEKKIRGEVFTPVDTINKMFNFLPPEIFKNPYIKWFDPANGMGNFMIVLFNILDNNAGLNHYNKKVKNKKGEIFDLKDAKQRKKWILEEMFYVSEINPLNCMVYEIIFNSEKKYKLNINCGNSLNLDIKKTFNIDKFDIIIGNPPYQDRSKNKSNSLWPIFIEKCIPIIKDDGYLLFIHPSKWRNYNNKIFKLIKKYNLKKLKILSKTEAKNIFKCNTRAEYYLLQKKEYENKTIINDTENKISTINIKKWEFLPNKDYKIIEKIISTTNKQKILQSESAYEIRKNHMSKFKDNTFKYPVIYTINSNNEPTLFYSSNNNCINSNMEHFGKKKVIFGNGAGIIYDKHGIYGMTQWNIGIEVSNDEEALKLISIIKSKKWENLIINALQTGANKYNKHILRLFKNKFWLDLKD